METFYEAKSQGVKHNTTKASQKPFEDLQAWGN
jgi:hypothetical protein